MNRCLSRAHAPGKIQRPDPPYRKSAQSRLERWAAGHTDKGTRLRVAVFSLQLLSQPPNIMWVIKGGLLFPQRGD
jgi:hypothetical protein